MPPARFCGISLVRRLTDPRRFALLAPGEKINVWPLESEAAEAEQENYFGGNEKKIAGIFSRLKSRIGW